MYSTLLFFHSIFRWFVLISLIYAIFRAVQGMISNKQFTKSDSNARTVAVTIAHIQLLIGLGLYFVSPIVDYFLHNFKVAVKIKDIRFFGMEHNIMMLIAIILITVGSALSKRKTDDKAKFKIMAIWFIIGLIIILVSIPWPFSEFVARPFFRMF